MKLGASQKKDIELGTEILKRIELKKRDIESVQSRQIIDITVIYSFDCNYHFDMYELLTIKPYH